LFKSVNSFVNSLITSALARKFSEGAAVLVHWS